ncbi:hypothetical protein C8Q79DRAFT_896747 [Trametes meyenii]|nr:hypothetical protein C8Q79DRAFT_896747 [Trametes meyenii]
MSATERPVIQATPSEGAQSPFSASFDPNASTPGPQQSLETPLALRGGLRFPAGQGAPGGGQADASALWQHRLSASFGAIADQIAAASRALATVDVPAGAAPSMGSADVALSAEVAGLAARLDVIQRTQDSMGAELKSVQEKLAALRVGVNAAVGGRDEKSRGDVVEEVLAVRDGEGGQPGLKTAAEIAVEELERKVQGVIDTIKLDQARLYARLHNATVMVNKQLITPPVMANGKTPPNFPNTKGEFEHLTKERYEALLKAYDLPLKGDTNAKKEALREFICLTPPV